MTNKKKIWAITGSLAAAALITGGAGFALANKEDSTKNDDTAVTIPADQQQNNTAPSPVSASDVDTPDQTYSAPSAASAPDSTPAQTYSAPSAVSAPDTASAPSAQSY
ncbi:MAG: hypothetical protein GX483_07685 [Actinomycetaceae bacterium]|nr:hypothetical protein [Actinomycetaceae bacterium]